MRIQSNTADTSGFNVSALSGELGMARIVAVVFAGAMLFVVGFAQATPMHNAAHDTRHIQIFPCH